MNRPTVPARWIGVAALALLAPPASRAAQESSRSITLAQAVAYALAHNPRVSEAGAGRLAAQGRTDAARAGLLPEVSIVAQLNRGTGNVVPGSLFSLRGIPNVSGPPRGRTFDSGVWGSTVGASASWDVLLLERQMAVVDAALADEGRTEAAMAALKLEVAFNAADRFLAALSRGEIVRAARAGVDRDRVFVQIVKVLTDQTLRPGVDLSRAQAELAIAQAQLIRTEQNEAVARIIKGAIPKMRSLIPEDIKVALEFDQSIYVRSAIRGLVTEGALGALLTSLVVLLFLRNWRSALIVVVTIPFSILAAVIGLRLTGQTLNIMTLGGLALAIGILVDEATVAIENINTHLATTSATGRAVVDAMREVMLPRFLAMLVVISVFIPALFMVGIGRALFPPLALAVAFSMIASYLLSSTLVPVMAAWLFGRQRQEKPEHERASRFRAVQDRYDRFISRTLQHRGLVIGVYALAAGALLISLGFIRTELFPRVDAGQLQVRIRAPAGTRLERTEEIVRKVDRMIRDEAGDGFVTMTLANVGNPPWNYPVNGVFVWDSGPHEALLLAALQSGKRATIPVLEERLRRKLGAEFPGVRFSFEPGDIVSQVLNFGSPAAINVTVSGNQLDDTRAFAEKLKGALARIPTLRDVQIPQSLDYPTLNVNIDRERAGQLGVSVDQIGKSIVGATSSSELITPNFWVKPTSGIPYRVGVQVAENQITSIEDLRNLTIMPNGAPRPLLGDVAQVVGGKTYGELDHLNSQRMISVTANVVGGNLAHAAAEVERAIRDAGAPPRGTTVALHGQAEQMEKTLSSLKEGVALAVMVVLLLLTANFQSVRDAVAVLAVVPAVLGGVVLMLFATGTSLNIESLMGTIMAIGVSVANALLLVTFARERRCAGEEAQDAVRAAGRARLRPIVMTGLAMIAGMIPMAFGFGEGGEQSAPLGRAVIGGLLASTVATLVIVPAVYTVLAGKKRFRSPSLHPDDAEPAQADAWTEPGSPRRSPPRGARGPSQGPRLERSARVKRLCLLVLLFAPACERSADPAPAAAPAGPPQVEVVPVASEMLHLTVALPGELTPYEAVAIYPRVTGFVEQILVDRGSVVRKGTLLARLSAPELASQRAEAESKTAGSQRTVERLRAASSTPGVVAGHDVELAEAALNAEKARVSSLKTLESYLVVRAPFDGVVTERNVHPGALLGPPADANAVPMLRIEQVSHLRLTVAVPENDVGAIAEGGPAEFAVQAWPGKRFSGIVKRVAHAIDPKTRTMPVELDVENPGGKLASGMYAEVRWPIVRSAPSLLVPTTAVAQTTERTFVDRVRDGTLEQVPVRRGAVVGERVEVIGQLSPGDQVLKRGSEELQNNARVSPKRPDAGAKG